MSDNSEEDEFLPEKPVGVIGKEWTPQKEGRKDVPLEFDRIPKHLRVLTDEEEEERRKKKSERGRLYRLKNKEVLKEKRRTKRLKEKELSSEEKIIKSIKVKDKLQSLENPLLDFELSRWICSECEKLKKEFDFTTIPDDNDTKPVYQKDGFICSKCGEKKYFLITH